jgi:carbon starvation protein CstA
MARQETSTDDLVIEHPNRDKASSKVTRLVVMLLLLVSAALVTIISLGGWETLQGAKVIQVGYIAIYVGMAYMVLRWRRGVLPVIAALAIILGIFAAVAGPQWFDRTKDGFTSPAIPEDILGLLTLILVPVQALLIGFAMQGFAQAWNVEVERRPDGSTRAMPQRA